MEEHNDYKIKKIHDKKIYNDFGDDLVSLYSIKQKCCNSSTYYHERHKNFREGYYPNFKSNVKTEFDFITKFKLIFYAENGYPYNKIYGLTNSDIILSSHLDKIYCSYCVNLKKNILFLILNKNKIKIKNNKIVIPLYILYYNYNNFQNFNNNLIIKIENVIECLSKNVKIKYIVGNLKKNKNHNNKINNIVRTPGWGISRITGFEHCNFFSINELSFYNKKCYEHKSKKYTYYFNINKHDTILFLIVREYYPYNMKLKMMCKFNNIKLEKKNIKKIKILKTNVYAIAFRKSFKKTIKKIKKNKYIDKHVNENETSKLTIKSNIHLDFFDKIMFKK